VAVCPVGAITLEGYDHSELIITRPDSCRVNPEQLLLQMKYGRSVRSFNARVPADADIADLIEAGRYAPSGGNRQPLRYVVIKNVPEIVDLSMEAFAETLALPDKEQSVRAFGGYEAYVKKWTSQLNRYAVDQEDRLFFHAPVVIVIIGSSLYTIDAGIAISRMDIMCSSKGMAACIIGFFRMVADMSPKIRQRLNLRDKEKVLAALAVGYSDLRYHTTKLRRKAQVEYI